MRGESSGASTAQIDDRGVSPVVATILLVAVVVILAAVATAGINDAGLGKGKEPAPQVAFEPTYDEDTDELRLTHKAGEELETSQIEIRGVGSASVTPQPFPGLLKTGDSIEIHDVQDDERLIIIWTSQHDHTDKHVIYRWPHQ